ncbi:hypothetical protein BVC80_6213g1 [Macleaya cordata]|uniref:Uncharacterized protein n=1 Tax=Macleaya cordata TaxID=56857 RepID=A0A200QWE8_MACCD|nr:hypothetical protein BVC80_6213g1 [Macleaya cordata]
MPSTSGSPRTPPNSVPPSQGLSSSMLQSSPSPSESGDEPALDSSWPIRDRHPPPYLKDYVCAVAGCTSTYAYPLTNYLTYQ